MSVSLNPEPVPRRRRLRPRRRRVTWGLRAFQLGCMAMALVATAGLLYLPQSQQPQAQAAGVTDSHITIDWADGKVETGADAVFSAEDVAKLQPSRDATSARLRSAQ